MVYMAHLLVSLTFGSLGVVAEPSTRLARQQEKTKAQARARASRASSGEMAGRERTTIRDASLTMQHLTNRRPVLVIFDFGLGLRASQQLCEELLHELRLR